MKKLICFKVTHIFSFLLKKIDIAVLFILLLSSYSGIAEAQQQIAKSPWQDAYSASAFADGVIRESYCDLVSLVEGTFGGLLFAAAGLMAFGFAAFGDSKHGSTAAIVAGAAFTLGGGVSLYFGDLGCGTGQLNRAVGANGAAGARTKIADVQFDPSLWIDTSQDEEDALF